MSYFDQFELQGFQNLELLARQVVEGFIIGLHKSPFHGFSVEFAEHRLYNPGESTQHIDWKIFARTDRLYTKKFEEETNLRCQVVIDTSSSMYFPEPTPDGRQLNKLRFSALAAASLMQLLKKQRDAFGLSMFSDKLDLHTRCKSNTTHFKLLLSYLEQAIFQADMHKQTRATEALHQIADSIHKRSLVIIFSDMMEEHQETDKLLSALQHLRHNKHEVVLFHIMDKNKEIDFAYDNKPYVFVDMETGEKVKLRGGEIQKKYKEQMQTFLETLKLKCLQYRIDLVPVDIEQGFHPVLQSYLVKRKKMGT